MDWTFIIMCGLTGLLGLLAGYIICRHRARKQRQSMLRQLDAKSLELLETQTSLRASATALKDKNSREKLLGLTLTRLRDTERAYQQLQKTLEQQKKQHFFEMSKLRLQVTKNRQTAVKATQIARRALSRVRQPATPGTASQRSDYPNAKKRVKKPHEHRIKLCSPSPFNKQSFVQTSEPGTTAQQSN